MVEDPMVAFCQINYYCVAFRNHLTVSSAMDEDETALTQMTEELAEELPDWGGLNKRFASLNLADETIPKRSEKDFDIDHTGVQSSALAEARKQMFNALDHIRGHHEKQTLVGVWMHPIKQCLVPHAKGNFFRDMGNSQPFPNKPRLQGCWLLAIETVYLVERGSLILYLPSSEFETFLASDELVYDYSNLKQISLSHLYSLAFENSPDMHDKYQVYALLKRLGYLIRPYQLSKWPDLFDCQNNEQSLLAFFQRSITSVGYWFRSRTSREGIRSLHFLSYTDMFSQLQYISARLDFDDVETSKKDPKYVLHFDVWKPTGNFSKKTATSPDYQVCVVNTLEKGFPSFVDITSLWQISRMKYTSALPAKDTKPAKTKKGVSGSKKEMRAEKAAERRRKMDPETLAKQEYNRIRDQKLKNGSSGRSIIIAAIDGGIINFSSLRETDFHLRSEISNGDLNILRPQIMHGIVHQEDLKV